MIVAFVDVLSRVSLRIVTMPVQSQAIITRDNASVDVSAPLMSTTGELGSFLARETAAASVPGVDASDHDPVRHRIVSAASRPTNGVAPLVPARRGQHHPDQHRRGQVGDPAPRHHPGGTK